MIVDAQALSDAVESGLKIVGEKDTDFFLYTRKSRLYVLFRGQTIVYAKRIKVTEDAPLMETCLVPSSFAKLLAGKQGDLTITNAGPTKLGMVGKKFKAEIPTTERSVPPDIAGLLFAIPSKDEAIDVSNLTQLPSSLHKIMKSVRDNVSKSELAVRARWEKKTISIMIADNFHGVIMTSKTAEKIETPSEILLPLSTFVRVLSLGAGAKTFIDEKTVTVVSKDEYLMCRLKATANASITFDMMEGVLSAKTLSSCDVATPGMVATVAACSALSDSFPIKIRSKKTGKGLTVSMKSDFGSVTEELAAANQTGKPISATVNLFNFKDVLACLGSNFVMSMSNNMLLVNSVLDESEIRGGCILHQTDDE